MLYQNDSHAFVLPLTRTTTTVVAITSVSYNPSVNPSAVYSFTLASGPYPTLQNKIVITGMSHSGNNGSFTITNLVELIDSLGIVVGGTFSVTNTSAVTATESGTGTVGTAPNVTVSPVIQIVRLADFTSILGAPAAMTALDASNQIWVYIWSIGPALSGDYMAIVSYATDGDTFSGKFLEKVQIGDTRILGTLALDSTVAKDATVAKDSTVAKATDVQAVNPNNSTSIAAIKAKTDNLPTDPTGMTLLNTTIQNIADVHDAVLGSQVVDKTQNPAVYSLKRLDNSTLAQYHLIDDSTETSRVKI